MIVSSDAHVASEDTVSALFGKNWQQAKGNLVGSDFFFSGQMGDILTMK